MNEPIISAGLATLIRVDQDLARLCGQIGTPCPRPQPRGFEALLAAIVRQQISSTSAQAILSRLEDLLPSLSAPALLAADDQVLRAAGLSTRKIEYARGLAEAVVTGRFDIDRLDHMSDDEANAAITAQRGFGRWSADIYQLLSLHRPDVFPADDLALRVALGRLKGLAERPTATQARALVAHWAPWRGVGALLLWDYYRHLQTARAKEK